MALNLNPSVDPVEYPRLSKQCILFLKMFVNRPTVPNSMLHGRAFNHTARVSDLRRNGFDIECIHRDKVTGFSGYTLHGWGKANLEHIAALTLESFMEKFPNVDLFQNEYLRNTVWPQVEPYVRTVVRYRIDPIWRTQLTEQDIYEIISRSNFKDDEDLDTSPMF